MKKVFFFLIITWLFSIDCFPQSIAINNTGAAPDASAILDIQSNSKGLLIPRMTTVERNAIASPGIGLLIFDNTTGSFWLKTSGNWVELVDTSKNVWKRNGNNAYLAVNGNVGIGTIAPQYDLHIKKNDPSIGFTDVGDNHQSGTIVGDSVDLNINAYRKPFNGSNTAGDLLLQVSSGLFTAGNVGIGSSTPQSKLTINGGQRLNGNLTLQNLSVDKGSILRVGDDLLLGTSDNNPGGSLIFKLGQSEKMHITFDGNTRMGNTVSGTFVPNVIFTNNLELNRPEVTGAANLVPLAYGKINSNGSILGGSGNFSIAHSALGEFKISLFGESSVYANQDQYIILTSGIGNGILWNEAEIIVSVETDNTIKIKIRRYKISYGQRLCTCWDLDDARFSHLTSSTFFESVDQDFNFLIYKL